MTTRRRSRNEYFHPFQEICNKGFCDIAALMLSKDGYVFKEALSDGFFEAIQSSHLDIVKMISETTAFGDLDWVLGLVCAGDFAKEAGKVDDTPKVAQFIMQKIKGHVSPSRYVSALNRALLAHCEIYADVRVVRLLLDSGATDIEKAIQCAVDSGQKEVEILLKEFRDQQKCEKM